MILAIGSVLAVAILLLAWARQQRRDTQTTNERMRRALDRPYVEAGVNCRVLPEPEPPACPDCGTQWGIHAPDCEYWLGLMGESDIERDRR